MADLIKIVRTYRVTSGLAERIRLADEIFRLIEKDLRLFVFNSVAHPHAEDALQEVLKAIATSLKKFDGGTEKEFWAWCYRIARNKLSDHFREAKAERAEAVPPEELWRMMEVSAQTAPMTAAVRHDLEYALQLLTASQPECRDYLWQHFVFGFDYAEIAEAQNLNYDSVRMRIVRCLEEAKSLVISKAH